MAEPIVTWPEMEKVLDLLMDQELGRIALADGGPDLYRAQGRLQAIRAMRRIPQIHAALARKSEAPPDKWWELREKGVTPQ